MDGVAVHLRVSLGLDEYAYRMIRIKDAFAPDQVEDGRDVATAPIEAGQATPA